jgi:hypothetical protein
MRIGRGLIIPAILALGVAGASLASAEMAAATALAPAAHAQVSTASGGPNILYRG